MDGQTLGWAYGKAAPLEGRRLFSGATAQPARVQAHAGLQPFRGVPHAWHLRAVFHARTAGPERRRPRRARAPAVGPAHLQAAVNAAGRGDAAGSGRGPAGGNDMFRTLMMSGAGPDGYPLDVHGPTLPLPPQDPAWTQGALGRRGRTRGAPRARAGHLRPDAQP